MKMLKKHYTLYERITGLTHPPRFWCYSLSVLHGKYATRWPPPHQKN